MNSQKVPLIPIPGDRGFLGDTYPKALEQNMKEIRKIGFYNAKD